MQTKTEKNKIILVDADGVILNWEYAFCEWMEYNGHTPVPNHASHYKIRHKFGLEFDEQGNRMIKAFNESAVIGFLPPLRDAQHYIKLLAEKHGYRFLCVTSLSLNPYAQELRKRNIAKLFGDDTFVDVICLDTGADKDEVLEELAKTYAGNYWIEDKPENARVGARAGFNSLLVEHGHNMHEKDDEFKFVKDWEEIYNIITNNG